MPPAPSQRHLSRFCTAINEKAAGREKREDRHRHCVLVIRGAEVDHVVVREISPYGLLYSKNAPPDVLQPVEAVRACTGTSV